MKRIMMVAGLAVCVAAAGCGKKSEEKVSEKLTEKLLEKALSKDGVKTKVDLSGETMAFTTTDAEGRKTHVQMDGEAMTITGEDGQATFRATGEGKMPADFPADVHVYSGASVVSSFSTPSGVNLTLKSSAAPKDVAARYAAAMKDKGWTATSTTDMGDMIMLVFDKDDRKANVVVMAENGASTINVSVVKN
jgi:hypothetical protein